MNTNLPAEYKGKGAPGAFASIGYGKIVNDVWNDLKPGAVLQMWNTNSDYESLRDGKGYDNNDYMSTGARLSNEYFGTDISENGGHAGIFLRYKKVSFLGLEINTGFEFADQWGTVKEINRVADKYQKVFGANLKDTNTNNENEE